ncbi:hypothetical protein ACFZAR_36750 [Streptomyces sp. NPDC008222]|uniref:hypothetical protein n=1 Tax=Streptomyces sp. NPDC008222 TaxID=3364820 RepID=UPI0036E67B55
MKITIRRIPVVAALVCFCLPLVSCGTEHTGARAVGASGPGSSTADETSDDQSLPDTTTDDQSLPDETSDDQTLPGTTSDDQQDPGPPMGDTTDDDGGVPTAGPHRWFPMLREFRAYLTTNAPEADAAIATHVTSVYIRTPAGSTRAMAVVRVDYGVMEQEDADHTAKVFAHWRDSPYGDHGHVDVLGPAKTNAQQDW